MSNLAHLFFTKRLGHTGPRMAMFRLRSDIARGHIELGARSGLDLERVETIANGLQSGFPLHAILRGHTSLRILTLLLLGLLGPQDSTLAEGSLELFKLRRRHGCVLNDDKQQKRCFGSPLNFLAEEKSGLTASVGQVLPALLGDAA